MKENIEIKAVEGTTEIILREGKAEEIFNPVVLEVFGTIDAPLRFITNRLVQLTPFLKETNLLVFVEEGRIVLDVEETNPFGHVIEGKLTINSDVKQFCINDGKYQQPEDLATFLRMRKHLFQSSEQYMTVFTGLRSFTAKVKQEIAAIRTDTGDYETKRSQAVEHNIPKGFTLELPIFKGMPKVAIEVEILVSKSLEVTMYSSELIQKTDELTTLYLNDQVKAITKIAPDIVIINV
jgi:hypothetical protein